MSHEVPYLLPGILSDGSNFQALGFDTDACMDYAAYDPECFNVYDIVHDLAGVIKNDLETGVTAALVGASLGGMLIPFVVQQLRVIMPASSLSEVRCIIIDAPFGVESMIAAGCSPLAGRLIRSPIGQLLRPLASIKVGPKDQCIEIPDADMMRAIAGDDITDEMMTEDGWRAYVRRRAIAELGGHASQQWLEQLRWMTRVGHDGSLYRACKSLKGVNTTYLACLGPGNDVVKQPHAMVQWQRNVPGLHVVEKNVVHCGFLQQAPTFRGALAEILG